VSDIDEELQTSVVPDRQSRKPEQHISPPEISPPCVSHAISSAVAWTSDCVCSACGRLVHLKQRQLELHTDLIIA
jgi:hypothetical protein